MRGLAWALGTVIAVAVLLLAGILISAELGGRAEDEAAAEDGAALEFAGEAGGLKLMVEVNPTVPEVGRTASISGKLVDASGKAVADVVYQVSTYHLEDEKDMFNMKFAAPDGAFAINFQFFDGAPHEVRVSAEPDGDAARFAPVSAANEVDVKGFGPPLSVKIKSLTYMLLIVLAGIVAGLLIRGGIRFRSARPPARMGGEQAA